MVSRAVRGVTGASLWGGERQGARGGFDREAERDHLLLTIDRDGREQWDGSTLELEHLAGAILGREQARLFEARSLLANFLEVN